MTNFIDKVYPEPIHTTELWNIIDPSKLNTFQTCERKFFFQYVLGWQLDATNKHFVFGTAWHLAMEYLRLHGISQRNVEPAYQLFLEYYRNYFSEITDMDMAPKNPGNARIALEEYVDTYINRDSDLETLYTEVFASVPIDGSGRIMSGRLDAIIRHPDYGIIGIDFKTGSRLSQMWQRQWKTSLQMSFYYHVLNLAFMLDDVYGIWVDGMFFYKRKQKDAATLNIPVRVPVRKNNAMHQAWLSDVNHLFDMLEWNFEGLAQTSTSDPVMSCFPRRTSSCTMYNNICPYHDFCTAWANPLKHAAEPPLGFHVEHWDPRNDEDKPKPKAVFNGKTMEVQNEK